MLNIFFNPLVNQVKHIWFYIKKDNSDRPDWSKCGGHHLYLVTEVFVLPKWTHVWAKQLYIKLLQHLFSPISSLRARRTHIHSNCPLSDLLFSVVGSSVVLSIAAWFFLAIHSLPSLQIPLPQEQLQLSTIIYLFLQVPNINLVSASPTKPTWCFEQFHSNDSACLVQ